MPDTVRMVLVLTLICAASALALSAVKQVTEDKIAYQELKFVKGPAVRAVLEGADNDPIQDRADNLTLTSASGETVNKTVFPAKKNGKVSMVAFEVSKSGYHGDVTIMLGIDVETDKLSGVRVTGHTETPGLGARITEPDFYEQFAGLSKAEASLSSEGGDVDAVTGATISSVAVTGGVKYGLELYLENKETILNKTS